MIKFDTNFVIYHIHLENQNNINIFNYFNTFYIYLISSLFFIIPNLLIQHAVEKRVPELQTRKVRKEMINMVKRTFLGKPLVFEWRKFLSRDSLERQVLFDSYFPRVSSFESFYISGRKCQARKISTWYFRQEIKRP